jgi:hypothetical protein
MKAGKIGQFEKHTRGIGRRLLEDSGWKDGHGLGSRCQGRADAVDSRGQQGKSGLGFKTTAEGGGTASKRSFARVSREADIDDGKLVRISTIYDDK